MSILLSFRVCSSDEQRIDVEGRPVQFLTIQVLIVIFLLWVYISLSLQVSSSEPHETSFSEGERERGGRGRRYITYLVLFPEIRLKTEDYSNLSEKLSLPIQVARRVVIRQSLSEQFLVAFTEQVESNGTYQLPAGSPVSVIHFSHLSFMYPRVLYMYSTRHSQASSHFSDNY